MRSQSDAGARPIACGAAHFSRIAETRYGRATTNAADPKERKMDPWVAAMAATGTMASVDAKPPLPGETLV